MYVKWSRRQRVKGGDLVRASLVESVRRGRKVQSQHVRYLGYAPADRADPRALGRFWILATERVEALVTAGKVTPEQRHKVLSQLAAFVAPEVKS